MKFFDWFRKKPQAPAITFTTEIKVTKRIPRTDLPEFSVEGVNEIVSLLPFASEVLSAYPERLPLDAETLARLCVKGHNGRYIKVGEYPADIDRETVKDLMRRVYRWSDWPRRLHQLHRTSDLLVPQLRCNPDACDAARALEGKIASPDDLVRLPMDHCWDRPCHCDWRMVNKFRKNP